MYPSDDGPIRLRLLIAECREVRQRVERRRMELQARRREQEDAANPPHPPPRAALGSLHPGGAGDEPPG